MAAAAPSSKKRKRDDAVRGSVKRPKKRVRKQKEYHSSSEESDEVSDTSPTRSQLTRSDTDPDSGGDSSSDGVDDTDASARSQSHDPNEDDVSSSSGDEEEEGGVHLPGKRKPTSKRNDPDAFATSMSKILTTKLPQGARKDPLLSRSREATEVSNGLANERLERRAKAKIRADRKEELERGRVKDVLGLQSGMAGEVAEEEKRLRKIAQRGVVKLFNAVRAAQVKGEEAAREARKKGMVGYANREAKINEMSKQGFLDLINGDEKARSIEEAR